MKKWTCLTAVCVLLSLLVSITPPAFAGIPPHGEMSARSLYELGLFSGTGTDKDGAPIFDLDRTPTRGEAVTMLVRLLGKEQEAKAGTWTVPFDDVDDWLYPYVGYAYTNGLTMGVDADSFGSGELTDASQYLTLVLRALGYDSSIDFSWDRAEQFAYDIGLTSQRDLSESFDRGDVAYISYLALLTPSNGTEATLLQRLWQNGAVTMAQIIAAGLEDSFQSLSGPATKADVAHFLVSNFPIKAYVETYSPENMSDVDEDTEYASDIFTVINAGAMGIDDFALYFNPGRDCSYAEFGNMLYRLLTSSGCDLDELVPPKDEDTWYESGITLLTKLGIASTETDPFEAMPITLLTEDTAAKLRSVPGGEKIGTVSVHEAPVKVEYVDLAGKLYKITDYSSINLNVMNVNGKEALYIAAPTSRTISVDQYTPGNYSKIADLLSYAMGEYKLEKSDNPYLDGQIHLDRSGRVKTEHTEEYVSITLKKIITTISSSNRSISSLDFPDSNGGGILDIKGVEYVNGYLNVQDLLRYFGIDKTLSTREQEGLQILIIQ